MDKYNFLKATYELKNAFIAILSHQFNSIRIDSNIINNYNIENYCEFLANNNFEIYSGLMLEKMNTDKNNQLILIQEIKSDKYSIDSLYKIQDKIFFSLKSANNFIEMLYLELEHKISEDITTIPFINNFETSLIKTDKNNPIIQIIDDDNLIANIYIFNKNYNKYINYISTKLLYINNKYYCYIQFEYNKLINFLIENEVNNETLSNFN